MRLLLVLFLFSYYSSIAQHCGYDHTALIGVRPLDQNNQLIKGLRIIMLNENGTPLLVSKEIFKNSQYINSYIDTAEFWQNPSPTTTDHLKIREEYKRHFMQAGQDYILLTVNKGREEKGRYIIIEDIDGEANGGKFNNKIVNVKPEHIQGLCGYPDEKQFISGYLPLLIKLDPFIDRGKFVTTKKMSGYTFIYDKSPLAPCPECKDFYCESLIILGPDSTTLFNRVFTFKSGEENNKLSNNFEVEDYNFNGLPDFRFIQHDGQKANYFVCDKKRKIFVEDPLLNSFDKIEFNFKGKHLIGDKLAFYAYDSAVKDINKDNENLDFQSRYYVSGTATKYVKEFYRKYLYTKDGLRAENKTNYYQYENYTLTPISDTAYQQQEKTLANNEIIYHVTPFKFVLERNCKGVELPAEKGYYANKISVYDLKDNQHIHSIVAVGNQIKENPGCSDSLQIADYNFDGFPDFRICNIGISNKHNYYIYHKKRNTFIIEKTLSELFGLTFDFEHKIAKGNTERKEFMGYPWESPYQYYMETLQFKGTALENLIVTTTTYGIGTAVTAIAKYINQKRIYEGDSFAIKIQNNNLLSKTVGGFRFEVEFNPEEYKPSGEKGSYVKILNVYDKERRIGHYEMHGNYLKEVPHWLDSLEIADYNFDGFTDIRMYNSNFNNGRYVYFLYNPEPDVKQFYQDSYFSLLTASEFIPKENMMKGKISGDNQTMYFYLKNDTLTLTTQDNDLSKSPFIEECIYKNGNRKSLRSAYGKLEPEIKKEYGDYNFDGHEDFRQQSKKSPYYWNVFIYNPKNESFEKDTLLSKFEIFTYNKNERKLDGYYRVKSDELTWETYYYQWSFTEKKMKLYQEQTCNSKYPMSESQRCIIRTLIDGKWIETETFGAE